MDHIDLRALALVSLLSLGAGTAHADPYFGGASGRAGMDDYAPRSAAFVDDDETSEKYFFGLELGRHLRLEVAKVDFGAFDATLTDQLDLRGTSYSLLVESPVARRTHAFLRMGRFNWEGVDRGAPAPRMQHGNDGLWGVGLTYQLTRGLALRAEWERYDMGPYKADMPSLGLVIDF